MEEGEDKGKKEEEFLDPILMDDDQLKWILASSRTKRSGVPYQYKVNTKKRAIAMREGLESDEEEVEDLQDVEQIEEILCATYERKTRGPRMGGEDSHPFHINVSVEPINPCATNTPKRTPLFRQLKFRGSLTARSTSTVGETTGGANSGSTSQVSTPCVTEVAVQYLEWQDMIPLSDYQNFKEKQQKTLRSICSFVQRSGRKNRSLMKIPNLHAASDHAKRPRTRLVHESRHKQCP
jgi:hypothetical protein